LTALCCWGTPAIVSLLSAAGLGFLVHNAILVPLIIVFLGMNLWATFNSSKRHERREVLPIAGISALLIFFGFWFSTVLLGIGVVGIFMASGLDIYFSKTCKNGCRSA
jgi:mercuric ion transport protein